MKKRQLPRQFRQAGTEHAGYASRSTDGIPGIVEISDFGFMVKSVVAERSLRCSPRGVGNLLGAEVRKIAEFCSIVIGSRLRIHPGKFFLT